MEDLYGQHGIDTEYERKKVAYRPNIYFPDKERYARINPSIVIKIERAKDFTISQSITDYDQLIRRIENLMSYIKEKNTSETFKAYFKAADAKESKAMEEIESQLSSYRGSPDAEIYTLLTRMKSSLEERVIFLDRYYRSQITDNTNLEDLPEIEAASIDEWAMLESKFIQIEDKINEVYNSSSHEEEINTEIERQIHLLEQELAAIEMAKQTKEAFHTTLADTSYAHRNRYVMFSSIVDQMEELIKSPQNLIKGNLKDFIMQLSTLQDTAAAKSHLILSFRELKHQHAALKGQYMMIDDNKETFISKQQWMYQQMEVKTNQPLVNWLYNQSEDSIDAFHLFADILATSIQKTSEIYLNSNVELLRFYQQEAVFYEDQMSLIRKKEEIRRFLRIIEDLEEVGLITEDWAVEYLMTKGYAVS